MKTLALLIGSLNEGLSKREVHKCFEPNLDHYDIDEVDFLIEFSLEKGWIAETSEGRYVITFIGKEFVTSQLG